MELSLIVGAAILAGIIQGVTGFGSGIVLMMVLPMMFALPQSAGISSAICICLCAQMVYMYRKYVNFKKIILPSILYLIVCSIAIRFSTIVDQVLMKKVFGIFLIVLAIYYLFINKNNDRKKIGIALSIFCIVVSALCDGLFGIGGPLMVMYFLSTTHNTHEYLVTIQTFLCINCVYNTIFRICNGILLPEHLLYIGIGIIGIIIGGFIANKLVDKLDGVLIRKLIYIMIGISGIINII
jgi:hypothetical protein